MCILVLLHQRASFRNFYLQEASERFVNHCGANYSMDCNLKIFKYFNNRELMEYVTKEDK